MVNADTVKSRLYEFRNNARTIFVAGDLHGDLKTFQKIIKAWEGTPDAYIVLLGDYADRGENGLEIIESLIESSQNKKVVALKGNHEDYSASGKNLFNPCTLIEETERKRGDWLSYFQRILKPFFDNLYTAAILPGKILFVHGGISRFLPNLECLKHPPRQLEVELLWSDPGESPGEYPNQRGLGIKFGPDITESVLRILNVKQIIRSHQPTLALSSPYFHQKKKVVTISSTSVYGGQPFYLVIENTENEFIINVMR